MTAVAFHFNVSDKPTYLCRLLRKAVANGAKVVVTGSLESLLQLDKDLWIFSATEFLPHCWVEHDPDVVNHSPVVLAQSLRSPPFLNTLVNLGETVPEGFDQFERLIEIVTLEDLDRKIARGRWKYYAEGGHSLIRHDLQKAVA